MVFYSNFQGWMKSEQGAPDCTWIAHQLMKKIENFKLVSFLDLLREFRWNSFGFLLQFA
jgi:hypothetical protein